MPPPDFVCKHSLDGICRFASVLWRQGPLSCVGNKEDRDRCPRWSGKG